MRVLYLSYVDNRTGSGVHTQQFFAAFQSLNKEVFLHPRVSFEGKTNPRQGVPFFKKPPFPHVFREIRFLIAAFTKKIFQEIRLIRRVKPEVVILRSGRYFSSLVLCRLYRIPAVLELNGPVFEQRFLPAEHRLRGERIWEWLFKKVILNLSGHITVVSEPLRQHYLAQGLPADKVTALPNGVDIQKFHPDIKGERIRRKYGLLDKTVIGFSGNFAGWHGLDFLAEMIRELLTPDRSHQPVFLIVGSASRSFSGQNLPQVWTILPGYVPYEEMPEYLAAMDIVVAPYPRIEPFYFSPLKIFEAMAMGKPVLASAQGQIRELITDGLNGLLYAAGDKSSFLQKIKLLIEDETLRENLGREARRKIEQNYTWQHNAQSVVHICRRLVNLT